MAARKSTGLKRQVRLEAMSREPVLKKPKQLSAKLPALPMPKGVKTLKPKSVRPPMARTEKFPKAPSLKPARHKKEK